MAYSSPPPPPSPPPQQKHHDTTLTLALPPPPLPYVLISPKPHARRPRPEGAAAAALARVRSSPIGDSPPCTECGKRFPSWKALFGHMRCHPERQWRGITPPPHFRHASAAASASQFTVQEREVAASLLLLAGARLGAGKGKKSVAAVSPTARESLGTSVAAALGPDKCDDHKCSVCDRGFMSGQALGGHKRCHWERACAEAMTIATAGSSGSAMSEAAAVAVAVAKPTVLDLNLPPPGPSLERKSDQGRSLKEMLDLKLGY